MRQICYYGILVVCSVVASSSPITGVPTVRIALLLVIALLFCPLFRWIVKKRAVYKIMK